MAVEELKGFPEVGLGKETGEKSSEIGAGVSPETGPEAETDLEKDLTAEEEDPTAEEEAAEDLQSPSKKGAGGTGEMTLLDQVRKQ